MSDEVDRAVLAAIASLNETLPERRQVPLSLEASLRGLESLAVTSLVVGVEDAVREHLGREISLTDEATLALLESEERTPLATVETLADHVRALLG